MAKETKKPNTPDLDALNAIDLLYSKLNQRIMDGQTLLKKYNSNLDITTDYQKNLLLIEENLNLAIESKTNNTNKLRKVNDAIILQQDEIAKLTKEINKLQNNNAPQELIDLKRLGLDYQEQELDNLKKLKNETDKALKDSDKNTKNIVTQGDLFKSNLSTLEEIAKNRREIGKSDFKSLDYAKTIKEVEDQIVDSKNAGADAVTVALKERLALLHVAQKESDAQDKINSKISASRDNIVAFGDKLLNLVPGGKEGFLGKMLGLDTISKNLKDKVGGAMAKAFEAAGGGMKGFFAAGTAGAGSLMAALAPILPILLAIAAVAAIAKLFLDADKAVSDLSKSLGVSYKQAALVRDTAGEIANEMGMVGVTLKEVEKQMVDLKGATGINFGLLAKTNQKAKDFLETSTLLTAQYGMTADETVELNQAAAVLGSTSDKLALSAEKFGDEIVSSTKIMKDISKVSKTILFNFKGNVPALAAAVKQANMMGTSLDKVAAIGDKLLDIESSLASESKARVVLGRNLNLDAARYFALMGNEAQLMEEIKKQAGGVAKYETYSKYQRKVLAEALGMSNDELAEMMAKEKELQLLGYDAVKLAEIKEKARKGELDLTAELSKMSGPDAKARLKAIVDEERRAGIQEKLATLMARVTDLLYKLVEPLIPMVDNFINSLGDGKEITNDLIPMFKSVGEILVDLGKVLLPVIVFNLKMTKALWEGILFILKPVMQFIGWIADGINRMLGGLSDSKDSTTELKSDFGFLEGIAKVIGSIIGGWFVLGAAKKVFNVFKSIKDTVADTGKSFKNIFSKKIEAPEIKTTSKVPEVPEVPKVPDTKTPEVPDVVSKDMSKKGLTSGFKDNMRNLADGFKAMGEEGVGKGIFNTLLAGPALLIAVPAIPFILFMGKASLDKLKDNFTNLASGLTAMGEAGKAGIGNTALAGPALFLGLAGLPFIDKFNASSTDKLVANFENLANGLKKMEGTGNGSLALLGFAAAGALAIPSLLFLAGIAGVGERAESGLKALARGLEALGNPATIKFVGLGILAIGALGLAMIPFAYALNLAAPALEIFAKMVVDVFGKIPPIIEAVGGAIATIVTAIGDTVSKVISTIAESILKLEAVNPLKIAGLGYSLGALAVGLGALTAGSIISGLASFFGADPVDTLKELETIDGEKLKTTADGISGTAVGLESLNKLKLDNISDISQYITVLDDISSITGLSSVSKSIKSLAQSLRVLKLELNGITKKDIDQLEEFIKISKQNTGQNVVQIVSTSIGEATEKVKDGISFLSTHIYDSISNGFSRAKDAIKEWLGFSPSRIGKSIYTGIQSVSPRIKNSLVNTFKEAAVDPAVKQWLGESPSKIGNDIETGIASKAPDIFNTLKGIFKSAAEDPDVKQWFGKSPSKLGKSIYTGIHSVEPMIGKSLINPFKKTLNSPIIKSLLGENNESTFGKSIASGIGNALFPYVPNLFKNTFDKINVTEFEKLKFTWKVDDSALTDSEKKLKSIAVKFLEIAEKNPETFKDDFLTNYYTKTLKSLNEAAAAADPFYNYGAEKAAKAVNKATDEATKLSKPVQLDAIIKPNNIQTSSKVFEEKIIVPLDIKPSPIVEKYFKSRSPSKFGLDIANGVTLGMETIPKETKDVWNNVAKNATKSLNGANTELTINTNVDATTKQIIALSESIRELNNEMRKNSKELTKNSLGYTVQQERVENSKDSLETVRDILPESDTLTIEKKIFSIYKKAKKYAAPVMSGIKASVMAVRSGGLQELMSLSKGAISTSVGQGILPQLVGKGAETAGTSLLSTGTKLATKAIKGNAVGAAIGGVFDTAINIAEGKDWTESLGRAAITGVSSLIGGAFGSLVAPGAGTFAGGLAGGMAGDWLGDKIFGEDTPEEESEEKPTPTKQPATVKPVPQYAEIPMVKPYMYQAEVESTSNTQSLQKVEYLLAELVNKVDQPVLIKVGDRTINEMNNRTAIRRSYTANLNTGR